MPSTSSPGKFPSLPLYLSFHGAHHEWVPLKQLDMLIRSYRYSLCLATSIMLWMVVKKPPTDVTKRVRMNKHW